MYTVFVGMSGGVDSSVAAGVLKEQGHNVVGVYMKNWTQDLPGLSCPWKDDFRDAKRVAVKLGIDFRVFDFENQYKQKVVDYMIEEYKAGRTPNPDVMCNQEIKFKLFLDSATSEGAEAIAMGHYACAKNGSLYVAQNREKDQTYFLYRLKTEALKKTLFPIGDFSSKIDVRRYAQKQGLVTADKKDSQGICFVGKVGIKDFLSQYVEATPGPIVDAHGVEVGEHEGAIFYTIGQRHGLRVGGGLPYYVTHKDMKTNIVYVTTDLQDSQLWANEVTIRSTHWINKTPTDKTYMVRLRYRGPLVAATIKKDQGFAKLWLQQPQRAIAPGQSAVVYEKDEVLGGGIVSESRLTKN